MGQLVLATAIVFAMVIMLVCFLYIVFMCVMDYLAYRERTRANKELDRITREFQALQRELAELTMKKGAKDD